MGFGTRGLFRNVHFPEILEKLEILQILESPRLWKTKEIRPYSVDSRDVRENLEILENPSSENTAFVMTPSSCPEKVRAARVQNEFAPEKFLNRYEKREKGSEKRSETRLKKF